MSSSSSSSNVMASASASSETDVGVVVKTTSSNAGDSCTWYADEDCVRPRSCYDCLNTLISSDSCAINPSGECVGSAEYQAYVDSQAYYVPNYKYYPSSEYSYCESDDATCSKCIDEWSTQSSATVSSTASCTGKDGCICVSMCEVTDRIATIRNDEGCNSGSSSDSGSSVSTTERVLVAIAIGATIGLFFYAMVWILRRYIAVMRERERATRRTQRTTRSGHQLNLNGWKSLQQRLVESERAQLAREPLTAPVEASNAPTDPNAVAVTIDSRAEDEQEALPVMGTMLAANAATTTAVIVEQGEGYRPPSPSRMNDRQA